MDKRSFLQAVACASTLPGAAAGKGHAPPAKGPVLLTISGDVGCSNRGESDPALDQLMHKHGVSFRQARTFDYAELAALPAAEIRPTLEYDARRHSLRGPLLSRLLDLAGVRRSDSGPVAMRGFDGYTVRLAQQDVRERRFIVATHIDGSPLPLGGLGPLWAVFDADGFPGFAAKPLSERFGDCPWGLYSIHIGDDR